MLYSCGFVADVMFHITGHMPHAGSTELNFISRNAVSANVNGVRLWTWLR